MQKNLCEVCHDIFMGSTEHVCDSCHADAALGRAVRKEMERLRNIRDDDNSLSGLSDTEEDFLAELESLNQAALAAAGLMEVEK